MKWTAKDEIKRPKTLVANYKKATNTYHPNLDFVIDDRNVGHWWCRIRDLTDEFAAGEFIIEMFAAAKHPHEPPTFLVRTPNGVYEIDVNVCIGIGHFHREEFASAQGGMMGFMCQLLAGLMMWRELGRGLGILHPEYFGGDGNKEPSPSQRDAMEPALLREKRLFSERSKAHNMKRYPEIIAQFEQLPMLIAVRSLSRLGLPETMERRMRLAITGA